MNESEALAKMIAPGTKRPGKYREGVIQIHVTRACDKACFGCTQASNLGGKSYFITPKNFRLACESLKGYWGVVGVFGGNPATHPEFEVLCKILREYFPKNQCGLWCNHPRGKGQIMRATFDPSISNLNCHLDREAFDEFKRDWPESGPFGLDRDSRHSPVFVALKDVVPDEGERWELISNCDINKHWSAMVGQFRGQLRAWFCEIAGAQSILYQDDPTYPDTGIKLEKWEEGVVCTLPESDFVVWDAHQGHPVPRKWWEMRMDQFARQVRKHCHDCGVPLRGHGELACAEDGVEQTSETHKAIFQPKKKHRPVQVVQLRSELGEPLQKMTNYLGNGGKK